MSTPTKWTESEGKINDVITAKGGIYVHYKSFTQTKKSWVKVSM